MVDDIVQKIKDVIIPEMKLIPGIAAAYLFGSSIKGSITDRSDIDIAILFSEYPRDGIDRLDIMSSLSSTAGKDVDLVILNDASPILYHEILSNGELIFENNRGCRIQSEIKSRKLYEDYRHIHSIYMQGMRKRPV